MSAGCRLLGLDTLDTGGDGGCTVLSGTWFTGESLGPTDSGDAPCLLLQRRGSCVECEPVSACQH